jgi:hypothetical protein
MIKINWGTKLAFFAILFMIFVVSMVFVISRQDMPLVEADYYEKGINYQSEIDNNAQVDSLISMKIANVQVGNQPMGLNLFIEKKSDGDIAEADLFYYRPSDPKLDQHQKISIPSKKLIALPLADLIQGKWIIKLTWMQAEKKFELKKEFDR